MSQFKKYETQVWHGNKYRTIYKGNYERAMITSNKSYWRRTGKTRVIMIISEIISETPKLKS